MTVKFDQKLCVLAATLLSLPAFTVAQAQQSGSNAKPSAYGNAYQGTSQPVEEPIVANGNVSSDAEASAPQPAPDVAPPPPPPTMRHATVAQNPDAGIVEVPVPDEKPLAETASVPVLQSHGYNPDADIVTTVPGSPNQLPEGTPFHARLLEEISAETVRPGTPFSAQMTENVVHMGTIVIPVGSYIHGRVTYVSAGRRIGGQSTLRLRPEDVVLPDGTQYHFRGVVTQTAGSDTKTNAEGEVVSKGHAARTGAEYGMTAGSGAVLGAVVAGPVGAGVGAGIGAGLMTVHWLRERNAAILPAGSSVTFGLSTPIALTAMAAAPAMTTNTQLSSPPPAPVSTYIEPKVQN